MHNINIQITDDLKNHLQKHLESSAPKEFFNVFHYAVLPTGKLFRANLIWRFYCDLNKIEFESLKTSDHPQIQFLSSSIELHHAYTLIHDDLPCMDNDDYRRGKLSTHKMFNEWKALLAGDGLLNLSYELLSCIEHPKTLSLIKEYSQLCGPNGLILGQYLDLKQDTESFNFKNS